MLNLDTEDWTEIFIGCAGGGDSILTLPIDVEAPAAGATALQLSITGKHSAQPHEQVLCCKLELCSGCVRNSLVSISTAGRLESMHQVKLNRFTNLQP